MLSSPSKTKISKRDYVWKVKSVIMPPFCTWFSSKKPLILNSSSARLLTPVKANLDTIKSEPVHDLATVTRKN